MQISMFYKDHMTYILLWFGSGTMYCNWQMDTERALFISGCQEKIVTWVQQKQTVQSPGAAGVCVLNTETLAYPSLIVTDSKTTKNNVYFL